MPLKTTFFMASKIVEKHGQALIGNRVFTEAMGGYPGGWATVTEIAPDPNAPEIVFQVKHPVFGTIGVFDYERVGLGGGYLQ